jgi:hypothetical protein
MSNSESDIELAWTKFYAEYGNAMVAWQLIESELATLFSFLTRIPPDMAVQIFYSARSFNGRIDIFKSALVTCKCSKEIISFARSLITKAKQYSDSRNKFAHDQPLLQQRGHPATFEIIVVDGKGQFQSEKIRQQYIDAAVTVSDITEIATAFRQLAKLIGDFWSQLSTRTASLDTLRERLLALPSLRPSRDRGQRGAKPWTRPQSSEN